MSTQRGQWTYVRDAILFCLGIVLILKQAGILLAPPEDGVSLELLFIGALFCNGPLFLSYLTARRGTPSSSPPPPAVEPGSPSGPQSDTSSGGK